jgi:hypothetical protein
MGCESIQLTSLLSSDHPERLDGAERSSPHLVSRLIVIHLPISTHPSAQANRTRVPSFGADSMPCQSEWDRSAASPTPVVSSSTATDSVVNHLSPFSFDPSRLKDDVFESRATAGRAYPYGPVNRSPRVCQALLEPYPVCLM